MTNSIIQPISNSKIALNGFRVAFEAACIAWGCVYRNCFIRVPGQHSFDVYFKYITK